MAKKAATFRLEVALLDWVAGYAKSRGTSQGVVVEAALRSLQEDSANGVPELPVTDTPAVRQERARAAAPVVPARALVGRDPDAMSRQQKLNAAAARRRAGS